MTVLGFPMIQVLTDTNLPELSRSSYQPDHEYIVHYSSLYHDQLPYFHSLVYEGPQNYWVYVSIWWVDYPVSLPPTLE